MFMRMPATGRTISPRPLILATLFVALALVAARPAMAQPIIVEDILRSTPGGIIRGSLATIDLQDPRVQVLITGATGTANEATLQTTTAWRTSVNADLAINANYFSAASYTTGVAADVIGLSVSNGVLVSPARQFGTFPDPALTISSGKVATIGYVAPGTTGLWNAIAGVGPSNTDADPGTMLITDGVNTGATTRVQPAARDPRTIVAVNRTGNLLYLLVIDGRQTGWSVGMTLPEAADLLLERGAWRAINLDGGGSSSFVYKRPDNTIFQNRPSDGSMRPVANHLGIKLTTTTVTDRFERPIRAVWMRPPGGITTTFPNTADLAAFEGALPTLASAGIQDIFLETFFWGRTTNNSSVYNDRFSIDYLAQAIVIAAKYGMRVHAWCEMSYQGFGTSGDYLLSSTGAGDQNGRTGDPLWRVVSRAGGTVYGDVNIVGAMFVNPIHPGVRARLADYMSELAAYPGLAGIFLDYCRYPVDDVTTDSFTAPWSYDSWSRGAFQAAGFGDPFNTAATSAGADWNNFITWRRQGITDTISTLFAGVSARSRGVTWAAAVFPDPLNSAQLPKMQDWGTWMSTYALQISAPMCYSSTQSSITSEVNAALVQAGSRRIVPALAYPGTTGHPSVATQLAAIRGATRQVEDFSWFEFSYFTTQTGAATNRTALKSWIDTTAKAQVGDINRDGFIDARDRALFAALFTGTPITTTTGNRRYDLNNDGIIDDADRRLLDVQFGRFHFGEDGVVDLRDLQALRNSYIVGTTPGTTTLLNLWDLNGDGSVNYADEVILYSYLTLPVAPDTDVNRDGRTDIEDVYAQVNNPVVDVNRDGVINAADIAELIRALRGGEPADMNTR